ncbi:MAG: hypothetical protein ACKN9V_10705 [Pseudomonadota bacterium]
MKLNSKIAKLFLLAFIIGEGFVLGLIWKQTEPITMKAALSKEGAHYILRWVNTDQTITVKIFKSPIEAIAFAKDQLNLSPGANPNLSDSLENIWTRKEIGKEVIFWKTMNFNRVHRLTFDNENHARSFIQAFKQGAYSPSPIGHAIYFIRASAQ